MQNIVSSWRKPCRKIISENVFPKFMILQCKTLCKWQYLCTKYCHLQRDLHCKITDFERFYFENNFPTRFSPRRNNIFHSFLFFHLRLYFYYPKKHKSDHNNKKRKSKFRVIESWQKKKEQYQLFGTIKENNCYISPDGWVGA